MNTRTAVMSAHVSASAHCSGFLEKKSPKLFKSWQERWFVMSEGKLKYYKNRDDTEVAGEIDLRDASWQWSGGCDREFIVQISYQDHKGRDNRKYELRANDAEEAKRWMAALKRSLA